MEPFSFPQNKTLVMGIINLSHDSFYEKSRYKTVEQAIRAAESMLEEGADILDIGAESSRPGSVPISPQEESKRLLPVLSQLVKVANVPISVDTYKPVVAQQVLQEGASIINDITGLQKYEEMAQTISRFKAGVILMHMQGSPESMQENPQYRDVLKEVLEYLRQSISIAVSAGIVRENIAVDPGIGFGKTDSHNLTLLNNINCFNELGQPVLLGVSRKSIIGNILDTPAEERLEGSLAAAVSGVMRGVSIVRTHDVLATRRAIKVAEAIMKEEI
ncbi:MAG: dihydropteroate synthase [Nitrospinae bacterium]|nr:dihydropteroate synthase [Nitrospinota bacterium]